MKNAICHVYGQCNQLGGRLVEELDFLENLGIPADITVPSRLDPAQIRRLSRWSDAGGLVAPSLFPPDIDPACRDANWWAYDAATCLRLLDLAQQQLRQQGFGELEALTTYTPGNGLIEACRRRGVAYLLGFCAPTLIHDGHWQITHTGAPLGPYLAGGEDYRKPGLEARPVLVSSMELRNPLTCAEHWSEGPFCPLNLMMGDRTIETGEAPLETLAACEDWIRLSELTGQPRFFHLNLQWFTSPRCLDLNRRCLEWLGRQARMGRLAFTTLRRHADVLTKAGGVLPQTTWWRGSCMGQTIGGQPAGGVGCIVRESAAGQWQFRQGEAGPCRFYDYRRRWACVPFDPLGLDPAFTSTTATIQDLTCEAQAGDRVSVRFSWQAERAGTLCCWTACNGLRAPFQVIEAGGLAVEFVPHPGGVGGAILFEAPATSGQARIVFAHTGSAEERHSRRWSDLVTLESVVIDDRPVTRIAANVPAPLRLPLATTCSHRVRWDAVNGGEVRSGLLHPGDQIEIDLDARRGASVVRLWDVDAAGILEPVAALAAERTRLITAAQAVAADLAPGAPPPAGPLCFGSEASIPPWAHAVARAASDREIALLDPLALRLGAGRLVASGHLACDLPLGTKGRIRAGGYDRWWQAGEAGLFAIFYDYGQSYGPGLTGWNQFWQIDLGVRGLEQAGRYRLVLNLYDPECRHAAVRILGRQCDAHGRPLDDQPTYELRGQGPVAQGIQARHAPAALVVVDLPAALSAGGLVDLAIRSHSEAVRYDRQAEGYGFVFLSHAWLFRMDP